MTITEMFSWFDILQDKAGSPYFSDAEKQQIFRRAQQKFVTDQLFLVTNPSLKGNDGSARIYSSMESSMEGVEALSPLIIEDLSIATNSNGEIQKSNIDSAILAETQQSDVSYIEILSISKVIYNTSDVIYYDTSIPTANDDSSNTSGNGVFAIDSLWVNNTTGIAYVCTDATAGAAVWNVTTLDANNYLPVRFVRQNDYAKFKNNVFKKALASQPQYRISRNKLKFDPSGVNNYLITLVKEPVPVVFDAATPANNVDCELPPFTHDAIIAYAIEDATVATRDQALYMMNNMAKDAMSK